MRILNFKYIFKKIDMACFFIQSFLVFILQKKFSMKKKTLVSFFEIYKSTLNVSIFLVYVKKDVDFF